MVVQAFIEPVGSQFEARFGPCSQVFFFGAFGESGREVTWDSQCRRQMFTDVSYLTPSPRYTWLEAVAGTKFVVCCQQSGHTA